MANRRTTIISHLRLWATLTGADHFNRCS